MIVEVNGEEDSAEVVRVGGKKRSLGLGATITMMENGVAIELCDLDTLASFEEILEPLSRETGVGIPDFKVVNFRKIYDGVQIAFVQGWMECSMRCWR